MGRKIDFRVSHCCRAWSLVFAILLLVVQPGRVFGASSIFDDDWKPAKLPPRPEPSLDQPKGSPKTGPIVPAQRPIIAPAEIKPKYDRIRVPGNAELAPTRKTFRELFQKELSDTSTPARAALALKLLNEGMRCQDKLLDQYVLYAAAYQAALEAQDLALCFDVADAMSARFEVDAIALKAQVLLSGGLKASSPAAGWDNCRAAIPVLIGLIDAEDFFTAGKLSRLLQPIAAGDAFLKPVVAKWGKVVDTNRLSHEKYLKARERLRSTPDDHAAKQDIGEYFCYCKNDWDNGLPMLEGGTHTDIAKIAAEELRGTKTPDALQQLAAGWEATAGKQAESYRENIRAHAMGLYRMALLESTGLQKRAIELAMEKLQALTGHKWIDLLAIADPVKDTTRGKWARSGITLSTKGDHDQLELPYLPPTEYAFRIDFTPGGNTDTVFMRIAREGKTFRWMMGNNGNQLTNFELIDGKGLDGNKTIRKFKLVTGHRYVAVIEVLKDKLKAYIDGELIIEWPTDYHEFSIGKDGDWRAVDASKLAIGDWTTTTVFHRIEVMELSGTGTLSR